MLKMKQNINSEYSYYIVSILLAKQEVYIVTEFLNHNLRSKN